MAKTIKISTRAKWVYFDDNDEVVELGSISEAPEGATLFRLRSLPADTLVAMQLAANTSDLARAQGEGSRRAVAEIRGLIDDDGKELSVGPNDIDSFLQAMPFLDQLALGNFIQAEVNKQIKEASEARRGNAPSGTSRGRRRSGGTPTAGSRTASSATS